MAAYEPISVDVEELKFLADRLRMVAPAALRAWRAESAALGEEIRADAASRASRSERIAASGKVRVTKYGNVIVSFGGGDAYIAVPIENAGKGFVEHLTFGHAPKTNKNGLPAFLHPAMNANRGKAVAAVGAAVDAGIKAAELGD
jgi:hypothetical protein